MYTNHKFKDISNSDVESKLLKEELRIPNKINNIGKNISNHIEKEELHITKKPSIWDVNIRTYKGNKIKTDYFYMFGNPKLHDYSKEKRIRVNENHYKVHNGKEYRVDDFFNKKIYFGKPHIDPKFKPEGIPLIIDKVGQEDKEYNYVETEQDKRATTYKNEFPSLNDDDIEYEKHKSEYKKKFYDEFDKLEKDKNAMLNVEKNEDRKTAIKNEFHKKEQRLEKKIKKESLSVKPIKSPSTPLKRTSPNEEKVSSSRKSNSKTAGETGFVKEEAKIIDELSAPKKAETKTSTKDRKMIFDELEVEPSKKPKATFSDEPSEGKTSAAKKIVNKAEVKKTVHNIIDEAKTSAAKKIDDVIKHKMTELNAKKAIDKAIKKIGNKPKLQKIQNIVNEEAQIHKDVYQEPTPSKKEKKMEFDESDEPKGKRVPINLEPDEVQKFYTLMKGGKFNDDRIKEIKKLFDNDENIVRSMTKKELELYIKETYKLNFDIIKKNK